MKTTFKLEAEADAGRIREWRRYLHAHPELSGQETHTAAYIAELLRDLGYTPTEGVGGGRGLFADLRVNDGPFVALRADMDALPVSEETGLEFASTNPGVMHACGHDAHMAMLLGAAKLLFQHKKQITRSVRLIFQPHEELLPGGAAAMIDAGVLNNVEEIGALHVWAGLKSGQLSTRVGPTTAAVDIFQIVVHGKGGHAAMPEQCIDPIVAGAQIVTALQTIVSRSIPINESAVLSVGRFQAGTTDNVIPNETVIGGTIRTFNERIRESVNARVRDIATHVAEACGARVEISLTRGYPVLLNDQGAADRMIEAARLAGVVPEDMVELTPLGVGEDFAYYSQKIPAVFAFLGCSARGRQAHAHHHPCFTVDENVLPLGSALLAQFAAGAAFV